MAKGYKQVTILWGTNFAKRLYLNSAPPGQNYNDYHSRTSGELMGGPDQEILIAEPTYSNPYDAGHDKLQPRTFSIRVSPWGTSGATYDSAWHAKRHKLMKALYSGPLLLVVERRGVGNTGFHALECKCEGSPEVEPGIFELKLVAANPIFTETNLNTMGTNMTEDEDAPLPDPDFTEYPFAPDLSDWAFQREESIIETGNPSAANLSAAYNPTVTPYLGSAPTEPRIVARVGGVGRVWRFYREFQVTNQAPVALENHPVCVDLGDVSALVTAGYMRSDYGDVRLETISGVRKPIYVRPYPNHTSGPSLKVWFVIYSLQPGETKTLRVFYGNPYATLELETFQTKPMFHMYNSDNAHWEYYDFLPKYDQPQSRIKQWTPHTPGRRNLMWLWYSHPDFQPPSDATLVAQAGGKVEVWGRGSGYAGVEFNSPISLWSASFAYRTRTNFKAPFSFRIKKKDGTWVDDYSDGTGTGNRSWMYDVGNAGDSHLDLQEKYLANMGWAVGDTVRTVYTDGNVHTATITSIDPPNGTFGRLFMSVPIPVGQTIAQGTEVVQNPTGKGHTTVTRTFTAGDEPRGAAFTIRVDYPSFDLQGGWYAAAENCTVNFLTGEQIKIRWRVSSPTGGFTGLNFSDGYVFDLDNINNGYQIRGKIQNDNDGKYIRVNYVLPHLYDTLTIDCESHRVWYSEYDWAGRKYKPPVDAYSALIFEEVRDYWIRMLPDQTLSAVRFVHDQDSNFRNLTVGIYWHNKFF